MDIIELTKILVDCCAAGSIDGLVNAAGNAEDIGEGDSVKIKLSFNKGNDNVELKLLKCSTVAEGKTIDELEEYYDDLQKEYDELEEKEPEDTESAEHVEWARKLEELEDKIDDVTDKIGELEG